MANETIPISPQAISEIISQMNIFGSSFFRWLQVAGIIAAIWIIIQIITFVLNIKKSKEISQIKEDIKRIEQKIDSIHKN